MCSVLATTGCHRKSLALVTNHFLVQLRYARSRVFQNTPSKASITGRCNFSCPALCIRMWGGFLGSRFTSCLLICPRMIWYHTGCDNYQNSHPKPWDNFNKKCCLIQLTSNHVILTDEHAVTSKKGWVMESGVSCPWILGTDCMNLGPCIVTPSF